MQNQLGHWQAAERAAWEHFAKTHRACIEAAGFKLVLQFGKGDCGDSPLGTNAPVVVLGGHTQVVLYELGDPGGYPTREAIAVAAAWARAHPMYYSVDR